MQTKTKTKIKATSNELRETIATKAAVVHAIERTGFHDIIETERCRCDIVAIRFVNPFALHCFEIEQHETRHIFKNIRRNFKNGATRQLIVCNERVAKWISRRISKELEPHVHATITVTTKEQIHDYINP